MTLVGFPGKMPPAQQQQLEQYFLIYFVSCFGYGFGLWMWMTLGPNWQLATGDWQLACCVSVAAAAAAAAICAPWRQPTNLRFCCEPSPVCNFLYQFQESLLFCHLTNSTRPPAPVPVALHSPTLYLWFNKFFLLCNLWGQLSGKSLKLNSKLAAGKSQVSVSSQFIHLPLGPRSLPASSK